MRTDLPAGTVTFLFTDVEGSTRLLHSLGAESYADALAEHRGIIRSACTAEGGVEVDTQGDAFFFAFASAEGAVSAAASFPQALSSGPISVRVGLHTGSPLVTDEGYVGDDVHFAARVAATSHGGQIVCSGATAELLAPSDTVSQGIALVSLGTQRLKDIHEPVSIYQLGEGSFPSLKTIANSNQRSNSRKSSRNSPQLPALSGSSPWKIATTEKATSTVRRLPIRSTSSVEPLDPASSTKPSRPNTSASCSVVAPKSASTQPE